MGLKPGSKNYFILTRVKHLPKLLRITSSLIFKQNSRTLDSRNDVNNKNRTPSFFYMQIRSESLLEQ